MERYEKYKDSGIDWIGEIPEHWQSKKFKYLLSFINEKSSVELPKIGLENIESQTGRFISSDTDYEGDGTYFKVSDILYGKLRPYLAKVFLADFEGKAVGDFFVFRPKSELNPKYSHKLILSKGFIDITNSSTFGSKMPRVSPEFIANLVIYYPTLKEQKAIARYLDCKTAEIDKLIAQKERLIELYEEEKTAIINQAVTKGINPDVKLKPSGIDWLGDIPEHWEVKRLRYLGNCQNGVSKSADYFGSGYPFINYTDVYNNIELPQQVKGLAKSTDEDRISYSVKKGDIFFTRTSETIEEIGIASTCLHTIENAIFSGFLIRFRPFNSLLFTEFSKYYFRSYVRELFFVKEMNLVTRASLSQELLKRLPVLLPPLEEQKAIARYIETECDRIDTKIAKTKRIIELQKEYRTALISEAVTGKIKVPQLT